MCVWSKRNERKNPRSRTPTRSISLIMHVRSAPAKRRHCMMMRVNRYPRLKNRTRVTFYLQSLLPNAWLQLGAIIFSGPDKPRTKMKQGNPKAQRFKSERLPESFFFVETTIPEPKVSSYESQQITHFPAGRLVYRL